MTDQAHWHPEIVPHLMQLMDGGVARSRVLTVAVQYGVFTHLAEGERTAEGLARRTATSLRGMRMLLDALVGLDLLTKAGETYALTPVAAACLVRGQPGYLGAYWEGDWMWNIWGHLGETIRTGQPLRHVDRDPAGAEPFFRAYIPVL